MDSGKESGGAHAVSPTMQPAKPPISDAMKNSKPETSLGRVVQMLYTAKDVDVLWWGFTFLLKIMMFRLDSF